MGPALVAVLVLSEAIWVIIGTFCTGLERMLRDNNVLPTVGSRETPTAVKHVVFWIYFVSIDSEMQPLEIVKVSQLIGHTPLENIGVVF